jgi:hypothetical protein
MQVAAHARALAAIAALGLVACDVGADPDPGASMAAATVGMEMAGRAPAGTRPAPGDDDGGGASSAYEAMCAHYCRTLEKTMVYMCLQEGRPAAWCADQWRGHAQVCIEYRCQARAPDLAICFRQCDALARFYGPYCAAADPAGQLQCPLSPADEDRACRAGCVMPEPTIETVSPG